MDLDIGVGNALQDSNTIKLVETECFLSEISSSCSWSVSEKFSMGSVVTFIAIRPSSVWSIGSKFSILHAYGYGIHAFIQNIFQFIISVWKQKSYQPECKSSEGRSEHLWFILSSKTNFNLLNVELCVCACVFQRKATLFWLNLQIEHGAPWHRFFGIQRCTKCISIVCCIHFVWHSSNESQFGSVIFSKGAKYPTHTEHWTMDF